MSITIKEFDGYDLDEEVKLMGKKCATKKEACGTKKKAKEACGTKKKTKEACKTKKKK